MLIGTAPAAGGLFGACGVTGGQPLGHGELEHPQYAALQQCVAQNLRSVGGQLRGQRRGLRYPRRGLCPRLTACIAAASIALSSPLTRCWYTVWSAMVDEEPSPYVPVPAAPCPVSPSPSPSPHHDCRRLVDDDARASIRSSLVWLLYPP